MAATTTTTIRGVSLVTRQRGRSRDTFDLALSLDGIEIRRPGRPVQHMAWSRVSEWEMEERPGYVLLTLRGGGAATPLVVPGWTLDDLEVLMREVTADSRGSVPDAAPVTFRAAWRRLRRRPQLSWKAVTTVVLLGALVAAVTLVLLQSAGVIDWGFLGPTA